MGGAGQQVECIVIGAGAVGLAVARALAIAGREVIVLEENQAIGQETSVRNNEVIHAGFLYPAATLKARLCRPGRDMLYAYCAERGVAHRRLAKLMPAVSEAEIEALEALVRQGTAAGVHDLELLDGSEVQTLEPGMRCHAALLSPSSGIVDSHGLMLALQGEAEARGAIIAPGSRVTGGKTLERGFLLDVASGGETTRIACDLLVNAAGLGAERIARALDGYPAHLVPRIHLAKGEFHTCVGAPPFRHLVVPLGETLAQGGAYTLDLGGQCKLGPDLSFVEAKDYSVDPAAAGRFAAAARRYWPGADAARLSPGYAGIRPRVTGPGEPPGDWRVDGPATHGIAGLVHLLGIDTPGLTACLAIAEHVRESLQSAPTQPPAT